jgi:hypothetical protein
MNLRVIITALLTLLLAASISPCCQSAWLARSCSHCFTSSTGEAPTCCCSKSKSKPAERCCRFGDCRCSATAAKVKPAPAEQPIARSRLVVATVHFTADPVPSIITIRHGESFWREHEHAQGGRSLLRYHCALLI